MYSYITHKLFHYLLLIVSCMYSYPDIDIILRLPLRSGGVAGRQLRSLHTTTRMIARRWDRKPWENRKLF